MSHLIHKAFCLPKASGEKDFCNARWDTGSTVGDAHCNELISQTQIKWGSVFNSCLHHDGYEAHHNETLRRTPTLRSDRDRQYQTCITP